MTRRAVLFDMANTLLHFDGQAVARRLAELDGRPADPLVVRRVEAEVRRDGWPHRAWPGVDPRALPTLDLLAEMGRRLGLEEERARALAGDLLREMARRGESLWNQPDPDAPALLERLRAAGFRLGVVSNADRHAHALLEKAGLARYLELIFTSEEAGVEKPDPAIFRMALERLGLEAEEAVYVGDQLEVDVHGARAAGLAALLYDAWDLWPASPVPRLRRLGELPAHLGLDRLDRLPSIHSSEEGGSPAK
ncbi:MAG: HAD-IA family hydrolase [Bacillota bacterium]|nr:HAD-IA family hydrolase [Bacillota bacterium]